MQVAEVVRAKVTPGAKHPERMQHFVTTVKQALDEFEEQISFTDEDIRSRAYQKLLQAYKEALIPVWNQAGSVDIDVILETVSDKEMLGLHTMAKRLQPPPTMSKVTKEPRNIPGLETILTALKDRHPLESLPDAKTCTKIGEVFNKIYCAHKAYAEAAEGIAELSIEVTPSSTPCY